MDDWVLIDIWTRENRKGNGNGGVFGEFRGWHGKVKGFSVLAFVWILPGSRGGMRWGF